MTVKRGDVWLATLDPARGSEQAGTRPVLIFQNDTVSKFTTTVLAIPFTTNLRRASLPSCVQVGQGEGGLASDSVALCHQLRVIDTARLQRRLGAVSDATITKIEGSTLFTFGIT
ncbi:MAG TPA: type II toxin-antitoxin system PemK/MazF family toxin [Blastocatellia bacterium]|nr:type II toxin-antitoxin system PemK/MazF family toxin [Blastocatellia bacterium]